MNQHTALTVPPDTRVDACWKRIGIYGSKDCPELAAHSHCRNCPVFSRQAALLFDRPMPEGEDSAAEATPAMPVQAEASQSLMLFRLGAEWFALPTLALDEIVARSPIHSLPHRRDPGLLGLVNVRGQLVVCVSAARLLLGGGDAGDAGWLMVARHAGGRFAFPVDEVAKTIQRAPGERRPVPATLALSASGFTRGVVEWRGHSVGWLDDRALLAAFDRCLA
jgi:chemotaxis-related protein WspD